MHSHNSAMLNRTGFRAAWGRWLALAACLLGLSVPAAAAPLAIKVMGVLADGSTVPVTTDYRWTVEEDATKASVPGKPADKSNYSFSFHTSYMPVIAAGRVGTTKSAATGDPDVARLYAANPPDVCSGTAVSGCLNPAKRYYVSIAADGHQMGGAPVVFDAAGNPTATVYVNKYNLPTAQLSVFAFEDNNPINGAPDLPVEQGLAGFSVQLFEAGGTYGHSGGAVTQDAFSNPLGTTYNADGSVKVKGKGIIVTGPDGTATIKNLFPAKYTVVVVPPVGSDWHQTSTIEGGFGSDAWVKNNEPRFFQEFGPPGHHVFQGFVRSGKLVPGTLTGGKLLKGRIVNTHYSRPPIYTFEKAAPVNECWVGLNEANAGRALYATSCDKLSNFRIPDVPPGTYEIVVWDRPLDMIIATTTVTVAANDPVEKDLGDLPVASWFARYQGRVFQDINGDGLPFFKEAFNQPHIEIDLRTGLEKEVTKTYAAGDVKPSFGEGIANNIRFRDGSIYQSVITKQDGTFAFTELFPFFNWMVAEIDYARWKATGATIVVDEGGKVDCQILPNGTDAPCPLNDWRTGLWNAGKGLYGNADPALAYNPWIRLNPQLQPENGMKPYRTENCDENNGQCAVLLEGMQTFLSQTNHIEWGKQPYKFDENGGIAGIVHYAITRAEDDPRFAAAENWEPGIPRVQVNLYLDCDGDGKPDQPTNDGSGKCSDLSSKGYKYTPADVDNYPFCWSDAEFVKGNPDLCPNGVVQGPEDVKRAGTDSTFSFGDVFRWGSGSTVASANDQTTIGLTHTDSWDDNLPTKCPSVTAYNVPSTGEPLDCYDGLRNFNQIRPGVFDGGYAFGRVAGQPELPTFIGEQGKGVYIVEAVAPPGYLHQGNGDKNVVFGDSLAASTAQLPFACVGMELPVPATLTLFPGEDNPNFLAGQKTWNKCDLKAVPLVPGTNPAPDFHMFTEAPVAGHGVGFILDDTATEFNQYAPTFGEKYSPPHLPVSIQDWTGREISRVYSDQFGSYNFLVPSSFTINPPYPSGVMPSMMVACMNHPGPITTDPVTGAAYDKPQIDPYFNRNYTQFCYTLQYLPGKTTYLDTPVLPNSAFASVDKNPLDCECADGTPAIYSATNGDNGPWVPATGGTLTIVSQGTMDVVNPAYDPNVLWPAPATLSPGYSVATGPTDIRLQKTIKRDFGFGAEPGTISLNGVALTDVTTWSNDGIVVNIPQQAAGFTSGQLSIRRAVNGKESTVGLTLHVGGNAPKKVNLAGASGAYKTIQAAIEAAVPGDLITVAPGAYLEYVVLDKRVRLQGWGAGSVTINAAKASAGGLNAWRALIAKKIDAINDPTGAIDPDTGKVQQLPGPNRTFDVLPGQTLGYNDPNNEPILFAAEEGSGVLVLGKANSQGTNCASSVAELRIDGLTITGSDAGGGVLANGYACGLQVSNNRVVGNYGSYGGGIRIGHTELTNDAGANAVAQYTDAVNPNVGIHHNWVAQNGAADVLVGGAGGITMGTGATNYLVNDNYVCGNFSLGDGGGMAHMGVSSGARILNNKFYFNQTFNQSADPTGGGLFIGGQTALNGTDFPGTGNVTVDGNVMQANQAGAGAGGGLSIARTIRGDAVTVTNNMIINNVAAYAGGGVSMFGNQSTDIGLVNNTVASNVSTATNRQSFPNGVTAPSVPQVAGLAVLDASTAPKLLNNVLWANRSYVYIIDGLKSGLFNPGTTSVNAPGATPQYRDLGRVGGTVPGDFSPRYSLLTAGGLTGMAGANAGNEAYGSGPSGCGSTAPGSGAVQCNLFKAANDASIFLKSNDFTSVIDPLQPVVLAADGLVQLLSALTFDETGNFINVIFSPLTLWDSTGALRADYRIKQTSPIRDKGRDRSTGIFGTSIAANLVPTTDFEGDARSVTDIGADEFVARGDLAITKTANVASVGPGGAITYTVTVTNIGDVPVTGATVTDPLPTTLSGWTWTCAPATTAGCGTTGNSGTGSINKVLATLDPGASATFTITATVRTTTFVSVTNTARVATPVLVRDVNTANNTAAVTTAITLPKADVQITKTASVANVVRAGTLGYTIVVKNNGPAAVNGAVVADTRPTTLSSWSWSCAPATAAGCGTTGNTGTGNIAKTLGNLASGASVTFTISNAIVANSAVGTLSNTATVTVPTATIGVEDPNLANNTATATVNVLVPSGTLTPSPVAFGNQLTSTTTSPAKVVTFKNTTGAAIVLRTALNGGAVTLTGANPTNFAISNNTCVSGSTLAVDATCTVSMTFSPGTTTTQRNAALSVFAAGATTAMAIADVSGQGVNYSGTVTPSPVVFPATAVNVTSNIVTATFNNTTGVAISLRTGNNTPALSLTGTNANNFAIITTGQNASTCVNNATVPVDGSCSINLSFTPSAAGARTATINVFRAGSNTALATATLNGTGLLASATVAPNTLAFGNVAAGTTTASQNVVLTNTSTFPIAFTGVAFTGTGNTEFTQTNNCPASLAVNANCTISVSFKPTAAAARSVTMAVTDGAGTQNVALTGTGTVAAPTITPTTLSFGNVQILSASASLPVTITNNANIAVTFATPTFAGANGNNFAQTNTCGTSIPALGTCTVNVVLTPSTTGNRTGTMALNLGTGAVNVTLAGVGITPTVTPTSLAFGNVQVSATSAGQAVQVRNNALTALAITAPTITGTNAANFTQANTCGTSIAAGATCTITVSFAPGATTGNRSATLNVNLGVAGAQTVALTGTGALPAVTPTTLAFPATQTGLTSTALTVTVSNAAATSIPFSAPVLGGTAAANFAQNNTCGTSIAANASCTISVTFTPSATGARAGTLTVNPGGAGNQTITLTGTGSAPAATRNPTALSFGATTPVGSTTASQAVTLTNSGIGPLSFTNVTFTGTGNAEFAQTNDCPASLAVAASCTINVSFTPTSTAARNVTMNLNDAAGTQTVTLTGTGVQAALAYSWTNGGTVGAWGIGSGNRTITVTNTGNSAVTLGATPVAVANTSGTQFTPGATTCTAGTVLNANASCTVVVNRSRPLVSPAVSGTVSVNGSGIGLTPPTVLNMTGN